LRGIVLIEIKLVKPLPGAPSLSPLFIAGRHQGERKYKEK
jgi:hypothetical protein